MNPQTLIFLHVPKAGGSTLRNLLHHQYAPESCFGIESDINADINRLFATCPARRKQIRLVTGHMGFGAHVLFKDAKYITFLRSPVERVVSEYRFIKNNVHHALHLQVQDLTLLEYLNSGLSSQISNGQTRLIAGVCEPGVPGVVSSRDITSADYEQALINLERRFVLPSTLTYYDETLVLWAKEFGWSRPYYQRQNITQGEVLQPNARELDKINSLNSWDRQLYCYVQQQMNDAINGQPRAFKLEVLAYKALNWLYGKQCAVKHRLYALH